MVMRVALFVPCYVDQLYPHVAVAALTLLERLGVDVDVPFGAACCGQPLANAGFDHQALPVLERFADTFASHERIVVLSGSCTLHLRAHAASVREHHAGAHVGARVVELCAFLHDDVGLDRLSALGATFEQRVALHVGCHGLRGLGIARPSELQESPFNKLRAVVETVRGVEVRDLSRPDECCGFGGTFSVAEPDVSAKMGRDRLRDYHASGVDALVSTDVSCLMHLSGLARRADDALPMLHVAQLFAPAGDA